MPKAKVEIAFSAGFSTPLADRVYTDVSPYVEGDQALTITHGREDEQSTPPPGHLSLTLDNRDGRFTPEKASSPYYPNVKKGKPIRVSVRYPDTQSGNLLSANQASMETSIADWSAGGSVPPTLASSTTHADNGTKALRITWGTGGSFPQAYTTIPSLVIGRTYTAQARVWVTSGTPDLLLVIPGGVATGASTAVKGAFTTIFVTFTATAGTHDLQVWPATAPTSGQQVWVDSVMVDEGSTVGTFTTSPPPDYIRFTGYIDEWPLTWPDGSDSASHMTIGASTRRARLGNTAPLTSAIRAAYLADSPDAYWPMTEEPGTVRDSNGRPSFRDITNTTARRNKDVIASFYNTDAFAPVQWDGTPGPTDEQSLVRIPRTTDIANPDWQHYIGGSNVTTFGSNLVSFGGWFEVVARVVPMSSGTIDVDIARLFAGSGSYNDEVRFGVYNDGAGSRWVYILAVRRDDDGATIEQPPWYYVTTLEANEAVYDAAVDGELHHYLVGIFDTVAYLYVDGVAAAFTLLTVSTFTKPFRSIAMGPRTLFADLWVGHAATYDQPLTALHNAAATAASETVEERVVRVAGRVGVPANEIEVEDTIASDLGSQPEAGRSGAEVLDEVAVSSQSILYDARDGMLAMQARNHRYNAASAFTLNATTQEVQGDLTGVLDDRYLKNTVEATRAASEDLPVTVIDQDSIDEYGVYATQVQIVASSDLDVEAAAQNLVNLYAEPRFRVSTVAVDLTNLSAAQQAAVLTADIGTLFNVSSLPAQAPTDPLPLFLEGYTETITGTSHELSMNTTPGDDTGVWVLDDATLSVLNTTTIPAY